MSKKLDSRKKGRKVHRYTPEEIKYIRSRRLPYFSEWNELKKETALFNDKFAKKNPPAVTPRAYYAKAAVVKGRVQKPLRFRRSSVRYPRRAKWNNGGCSKSQDYMYRKR